MQTLKQIISPYVNTQNLFFLIAATVGTLFVFTIPLLWGQDETTHFGRAYQISEGHFMSIPATDYMGRGMSYGGWIPQNADKLITHVNADIPNGAKNANANYGIKWIIDPTDYSKLGNLPLENGKYQLYDFPNTAPYSPIAYIPNALGLRIAEVFRFNLAAAIYIARLFNLMFFIAVIYFVLRALKNLRSKWIVFTLSLLPMVMFQASTITADTVTITLAIVISSLFLKALCKQKLTKSETIVLLISVILLPIAKPTYLLFSFLILFIPKKFLTLFSSKIINFAKYISVVLGLALFAYWTYITKNLVNDPRLLLPVTWWNQVNTKQQIHYVASHPLTTLKTAIRSMFSVDQGLFEGAIGTFGFNAVVVPGIAILSSITAMIMAVLNSERLQVGKLKILAMMCVAIGSLTLLLGTFYVAITPVGWPNIQGLEGRYFIPFALLILIILGGLFEVRLSSSKKDLKIVSTTIVALVVFSLIISYVKYTYVTWG